MKYVFLYGYDHGGVGDFIKSLKMYINFSFKHHFQIYIYVKNKTILNHIIVKDKYKYIPSDDDKVMFFETPHIVRDKRMNMDEKICDLCLFDYLHFSDTICKRFESTTKHIERPYNCIHIRLGDRYCNKSFPPVPGDDRVKGKNIDEIVEKIVKDNGEFPLLLVSDNADVKSKYAKKYNNIIIFDIKILHLDPAYTKNVQYSEDDIVNNMIEYLMLCNASTIYSIGTSGFSYTASWFYNNKIVYY